MGKIVTVELDEATSQRADARLASGEYASMDEMVEEALAALERETLDREDFVRDHPEDVARIRALVQEALDDPRPPVPLEEALTYVEQRIRTRHLR